jgi:hypothetical protein
VYVRRGGVVPPLEPLYLGPYQVLDNGPKVFRLVIGDRAESVSIDRLISEYTNQLVYVPGMSNVVEDALSHPAATAAGTGRVCAAITDRSPLDLKDILCPQVQALHSSPGLRIVTQKVVPPAGTQGPLATGFLSNISMGPPILAGRRLATSSPPGMFGRVSPQMSPPGRRPVWAASRPRSTAMYRYPHNTTQVPIRRFSHIHVDLVGPLPACRGLHTCSLLLYIYIYFKPVGPRFFTGFFWLKKKTIYSIRRTRQQCSGLAVLQRTSHGSLLVLDRVFPSRTREAGLRGLDTRPSTRVERCCCPR